MDARAFRCGECGYEGPPEEVVHGFSVCPECGAMGVAAADHGPLAGSTFRYRQRLYGPLAQLLQRLTTPTIFDGADRAVARVRVLGPKPRRAIALLAGAALFTLGIVLLVALAPLLPDGEWALRIVTALVTLPLLYASVALVARLSPGPEVMVMGAGRDPRLLLRLRTVEDSGFTSVIDVEDATGARIGRLRLSRLGDVIYPLSHDRPLVELEPARAGATRVVARRAHRFLPGWVFETSDGETIGTYGLNPGLLTRDELQIAEDAPLDPRLFVAAILVARP